MDLTNVVLTDTYPAGATGGLVDAWVDWNRDGDGSDAGEQIATGFPLAANTTASLTATGGEVEDYPLTLGAAQPAIGAAKRASLVERVDGSTFRVVYEIAIENLGNVTLHQVRSVVDLATAFTNAGSFSVESVTSADFTVNGGFDGDADPNVLAAGNDLSAGLTGLIQLTVLVQPEGNPGPYECSTRVTGESVDAQDVEDESQDGEDPDPDGNGDPNDNGDPTVAMFQLSVLEIPTLSQWGLLLLGAALGLAALRRPRA